jgi:hypothetical protein
MTRLWVIGCVALVPFLLGPGRRSLNRPCPLPISMGLSTGLRAGSGATRMPKTTSTSRCWVFPANVSTVIAKLRHVGKRFWVRCKRFC